MWNDPREIFAWMHASRLIGSLLEREFNHVRSSLRSRRLEVAGEREKGRARGRHARAFSRARFFLCPLLPSACYAGYVRREKCKKINKQKHHWCSFLFVIFQRTWRKKLFAKTRERKLNFVFVLVLFFSFDYITGKSLIRQRRTRVIIYVECIRIRIQFTQIKLKSNLLFGVRHVFFFVFVYYRHCIS